MGGKISLRMLPGFQKRFRGIILQQAFARWLDIEGTKIELVTTTIANRQFFVDKFHILLYFRIRRKEGNEK